MRGLRTLAKLARTRLRAELIAAAARAGFRAFDERGQLLRGIDLRTDVQRAFPGLSPDVVLDVGAHHGESTEVFLNQWKCSTCHAFEPSGASFRVLSQRFRDEPRVRLWNVALGARPGTGTLVFPRGVHRSTMAQVRTEGASAGLDAAGASECVVVDTIDEFCRRHDLPRMTLLKVDAEGHDLEVLRGAEQMLQGGRIDLIQLEVGMNPENQVHVPIEVAKRHLEGLDYRLFALYSQRREWPTRAEKLRRTDAVFVRRQLAEHPLE